MKYQDYIWDLGGTLLDNYERSSQAFHQTMTEFNLPEAGHDEIYAALKCSTEEALKRFAPEETSFLQAYKRNEAIGLERPILFDGAHQVLATIVASGGRNFLWSHRNRQVLDILDRAGISDYFLDVITSEDGFARKPSPDALLFLKEKYKIRKGLVIGDREIDLEAGRRAGFATYHFDGQTSLTKILELD